jgi:hypothetical protein
MRSRSLSFAALAAVAEPKKSTQPEKSCSYSPLSWFFLLMLSRTFVQFGFLDSTCHTVAKQLLRSPVVITLFL